MKKLSLLILGLCIIFQTFSCKSENKEQNEGQNDSTEVSKSNNESAIVPLKIGVYDKSMAKDLKHVGEIVYGENWTDNNGNNILLLCEQVSQKQNEEGYLTTVNLHAYHYANSGKGFKLIREVQDHENNCNFDNRTRFVEESVNISDLDNNGYAEITFVYRLGCTSELSPDGLKLMMLENGNKYAIRGDTKVDYGYEKVGGKTQIDAEFNKAPSEFLQFAKKIWAEQQEHNFIVGKIRKFELEKLMKFKNANLFGVEPDWNVKIYDNYFTITPSLGENPIRYNYSEIHVSDNKIYISGEKPAGGEYSGAIVQVTKEKCNDGMSNTVYDYKVYVSFFQNKNNVSLNGCGKL